MNKGRNIGWNWNGWDEVEVLGLIDGMNQRKPESTRKNTRSVSYEQIASEWLKVIPYEILRLRRFNRNTIAQQASLTDLREKFPYVYNLNGQRHRWFDFFVRNYPLWTILNKGNNYTGKVSEVTLKFDEIRVLSEIEPQMVLDAWMREIDALTERNPQTEYVQDLVWIDLDNVSRYIKQTSEVLQLPGRDAALNRTLHRNLVDAKIIESFSMAWNQSRTHELTGKRHWAIPQVYYRHPVFERRYYVSSINFQGMHSHLREILLGPGISLDLNSSVWSFYRFVADLAGVPASVITQMLEDKNQFREQIASVLTNTYPNKRIKLVKTALTALGFGADPDAFKGLSQVIKNPEDLEAFNRHPLVKQLVSLREQLFIFIKNEFADEIQQLKKDPEFLVGRQFNHKKFMAKLYQTYETQLMQEVIEFINTTDTEVVMWIHDGIMLRGPAPDAYYNIIAKNMNPYASFEVRRIESQVYTNPLQHLTPDEHSQRMALEEARAQLWYQEQRQVYENI